MVSLALAWLAHTSKLAEWVNVAMGVRRNISRSQRGILHIFFKLLTLQCKCTFTKRFTVSTLQRKCPMKVRAPFAAILKFFSSGPVFKFAVSYHYQHSLFRCITCQRCLRLTATCEETHWLYRNLKWTFEDSLPCHCYATKSNSGTMHSQVSLR